MADNLLSADELAALAEGVDDGSIAIDTGFNTTLRFKKHDLASEDSSLGVNISSIDMINERFIRLFRPHLMDVLRTSPRVTPTKSQIVKFGQYVKDLKAPLSVNVVRMNPLRGYSLVVIDPTIVFSSLDSFFGGFGQGTVGTLLPGRMFTPMEMRIINMILDVTFKDIQEAWGPLMHVNLEFVSAEINPQFAQISDENDLVIVSRFETETATKNTGFIDLVHPYASLKPVRELLRSRVQSGDGNEDSDRQWRDEFEDAVNDSCLQASVVLGTIKSTIKDIEAMQAGDILYFKKPEFACLQAAGIPAFNVHVGTLGAQTAVQIAHAINPSNN
ncbi:MAG: flagellar motor switch protein FliM [Betaproteobacteria bacterium]|nr:flagellar motor switch protein FliM [Betaproteobacteria bacterium]